MKKRKTLAEIVRERASESILLDVHTLTSHLMGTCAWDIDEEIDGYTVVERLKLYCDELERREKEGTCNSTCSQ